MPRRTPGTRNTDGNHEHGSDERDARPCKAYSAAKALLALASDPDITAVFADVMMPGMSGLELAGVVGKLYPNVTIVLTSGYTPPELLAERDRLYRFTPKPYRIETVIQLLCGGG